MVSKIKELLKDYKLLLNNVPFMMTTMFIISTLAMNAAAAKVVFNAGNVALTGGFLISFMPFLAMDTVTRRMGARASIMLNVLSAFFNVLFVAFLALVAAIPTKDDYTHFNYIFSGVWFIVLASTIAFVVSGIVNSLLNSALGRIFKSNEVKAGEFFARSYISTFVGQAIDNFLFIFLTYTVFAPIFWHLDPMPVLTCVGTAIVGGFLELIVEVIFGPIGLIIVRGWEKDNIGHEYIDAHKDDKF